MEGVRVLEVAQFTFVPAAGAVLADWGAEVVKVEHAETGDAQRGIVKAFSHDVGSDGSSFAPLMDGPNRGKRSLGLALDKPGARSVLEELVRRSDVFLTNFLPGARAKLGIDVADIRAINPDIIYALGAGFGHTGPEADKGGYDATAFWARSGSADYVTPSGATTLTHQPAGAYGDSMGGLTIAGGVAAALFAPKADTKTGRTIMGRVDGKVAFITGAGRGQGRSHALRLAEEGADIIAVDRCRDFETVNYPMATPDDLKETARLVEACGRRVVAVEADVRERAQMVDAVGRGIAELGKIDVVVAQAAIAAMAGEPAVQAWIDGLDTNLVGTINAVHAALPHLKEGASIIATGSAAAFMPFAPGETIGADPGGTAYLVAKRALSQFMHELAANLASRGIRANVVHPTNVNTPMLHNPPMYKMFRPDIENPTREDAELAFPTQQAMPIPYIEPVDVSNAVVYLASDESRYVTGTQMRVDAGAYLKFQSYHL
ncbi:mycofactocin-coupled SDR family oxidoreductase [Yinghuangia sp. YIM S10712]|uniref:mycofactocin-coupled SDR family oxidoreductase n=1 Tax=Yinghuangia sp. YIM S10712 TaxID=3436930 RepID=UPI003F532357